MKGILTPLTSSNDTVISSGCTSFPFVTLIRKRDPPTEPATEIKKKNK